MGRAGTPFGEQPLALGDHVAAKVEVAALIAVNVHGESFQNVDHGEPPLSVTRSAHGTQDIRKRWMVATWPSASLMSVMGISLLPILLPFFSK